MTCASLFSGAGFADAGLIRAGFDPLWFCEIDRQCCDVLRHNHPGVPIYSDVRAFPADDAPVPDLLWFSPPCQDLSVAGKRAGLGGARSGLFYDAARIVTALGRRGLRFAVMEQVPGLLSSAGDEDFRRVLAALLQCGAHDVAWRILDSRYFGVAQRRRRVYFALDFGGERAGEILALAEGLQGATETRRPTRKEARSDLAGCLGAGGGNSGCPNDLDGMTYVAERVFAFRWNKSASQTMRVDCQTTDALQASPTSNPAIAFQPRMTRTSGGQPSWNLNHQLTAQAQNGDSKPCVAFQDDSRWIVRRLTPTECERCQGAEDGLTLHGRKQDGADYLMADGPRYRMAGNGVTATVSEWIGRRIAEALR